MREIISLFIGQAGCQIGKSVWELLTQEHGIGPDGKPSSEAVVDDSFSSLFSEVEVNRYVPRSLFIDLEPSVIDGITSGKYRDLFLPDQMVTGKEDAAGVYARGNYGLGEEIIDDVLCATSNLVERSDSIQGFMVFHSLGGGTGSGFTSLLMERLSSEYDSKAKVAFSVLPTPSSMRSTAVEPYNAVLAASAMLEHVDANFLLDNKSLFKICSKNLRIRRPSFTNVNGLIAQVVSSITAPLRLPGTLKKDLNEFQASLVAYPRLHFPLVSFSPLSFYGRRNTVEKITSDLFDQRSLMVECDAKSGKNMAVRLLYRGDVTAENVNDAISKLKMGKKIGFVDWMPHELKYGINAQPILNGDLGPVSRAVCMLANTTAMKEIWGRLIEKFDRLFNERAFLHWFHEDGTDDLEFWEARDNLGYLEAEYEEAAEEWYDGNDQSFPIDC